MIVAIVDQTSPVGQVRVRRFLSAVDEATAVTAFVNSFDPALNSADWLGFDTGWSVFQRPALGTFWAYDFGSPGLVQVAHMEHLTFRGIVQVVGDLKARSANTPNAWEDLGGVRMALRTVFPQIRRGCLRVWGRYTASSGAGPGAELRLASAGDDLGTTITLVDSASLAGFVLDTTPSPSPPSAPTLNGNLNVYRLQGRLNDPGATLEVELVSIAFLSDDFTDGV